MAPGEAPSSSEPRARAGKATALSVRDGVIARSSMPHSAADLDLVEDTRLRSQLELARSIDPAEFDELLGA